MQFSITEGFSPSFSARHAKPIGFVAPVVGGRMTNPSSFGSIATIETYIWYQHDATDD